MSDFKKCPFCAEEIQAKAKKCKHCSEWLDKNDNIQTETSQPSSSDIIETEEKPIEKDNSQNQKDKQEHMQAFQLHITPMKVLLKDLKPIGYIVIPGIILYVCGWYVISGEDFESVSRTMDLMLNKDGIAVRFNSKFYGLGITNRFFDSSIISWSGFGATIGLIMAWIKSLKKKLDETLGKK